MKDKNVPNKNLISMLFIFIFLVTSSVFAVWIPVGIGGGGAQYAPSISPIDPNIRFVGSDMKGWYRTGDGGASWNMVDFYQLLTDVDYGWNNGFMCKMAFHPVNPNIVYGYGPQQDTDNASNIMISNDGGVTWSVLNASPAWGSARVTVIYMDRANPALMLVGTDSGVFTSTNAGVSFTGPGGSSGYVSGIMIDQSIQTGNRTCYAGSWSGVFKSTDSGTSWTAFNAGLPSSNCAGFCGASTAGGSRLFEIDGSNYYLYTSLNGASWTLSSNADNFDMVACADNDTSTAYSINGSDRSVWKTSDGGGTWAETFVDTAPAANASLGWISYDLSFSWGAPNTMISVCPSDASRIMFTNYGETMLSNDSGATWQEAYSTYADTGARGAGKKWSSRGLEMTTAWHYVIDPNNANYRYICYTDIGFARSTDAGQTWYNTARKGTALQTWSNTFYQIAFNPTAGTILAAVGGLHDLDHSWPIGRAGTGGVVKSTDYGATWSPSSTGLPVSPTTSIIFDPVNNIYFAASWGNGVYKSTNASATNWVATAPVAIGSNHDVYSLKLVGTKLYCLLSAQKSYTNAGGLFMSSNQGANWTNISLSVDSGGNPLKYPTDFDVNPLDTNNIFIAAQDGGGLADGGLWRTTNGGTSWSLMNMPVGHTPYGFAPSIDPGNTSTVYYSTENQGIFKTVDGGATWARVTGLPFVSTQRVTFDTGATYVTTFGGGVWMEAAGNTPVNTPSKTATPVSSVTATPTKSATRTYTATQTPSATDTQTQTPLTPPTATSTDTGSPTQTVTVNPLWTFTDTATVTPAYTGTQTSTDTAVTTATFTQTQTPTFTGTAATTPALTETPTAGGTQSNTATSTPVVTPSSGFSLDNTFIYPDPITGSGSGFRLKLECKGAPVYVKMRIYSVAFRLVRELEWTTADISGSYEVNARASDLDKCANGAYYYDVTAKDNSGKEAKSKIDIFMILR
jgi:hypothetical protein